MKYLGGCDKEFYAAQECMNQEVGRSLTSLVLTKPVN